MVSLDISLSFLESLRPRLQSELINTLVRIPEPHMQSDSTDLYLSLMMEQLRAIQCLMEEKDRELFTSSSETDALYSSTHNDGDNGSSIIEADGNGGREYDGLIDTLFSQGRGIIQQSHQLFSRRGAKIFDYKGEKVAGFEISGRDMLCLPQMYELFLKELVGGLHTVYTKVKRLNIAPVICNVEQVRSLRSIGAIQPGVNRCKLIQNSDFDRLYHDCNSQASRPGRPPKRSRSGRSWTPETAVNNRNHSKRRDNLASFTSGSAPDEKEFSQRPTDPMLQAQALPFDSEWIVRQIQMVNAMQLLGGALPFAGAQQLFTTQLMAAATAAAPPTQQCYQQLLTSQPYGPAPDQVNSLKPQSGVEHPANTGNGKKGSKLGADEKGEENITSPTLDTSLLYPTRLESREKRSKSLGQQASRPLPNSRHWSGRIWSGNNSATGYSQSETSGTDTEREKSLSQSVSGRGGSSGSSRFLDSPSEIDQAIQALLSRVFSIEAALKEHQARMEAMAETSHTGKKKAGKHSKRS